MFGLVIFNGGSMKIYPKRQLILKEDHVIVKEKSGSFCANVLLYHENKEILLRTKSQLEKRVIVKMVLFDTSMKELPASSGVQDELSGRSIFMNESYCNTIVEEGVEEISVDENIPTEAEISSNPNHILEKQIKHYTTEGAEHTRQDSTVVLKKQQLYYGGLEDDTFEALEIAENRSKVLLCIPQDQEGEPETSNQDHTMENEVENWVTEENQRVSLTIALPEQELYHEGLEDNSFEMLQISRNEEKRVIIIEDIQVNTEGLVVKKTIHRNSPKIYSIGKKKEYCIFCKELKTQLSRHFVRCHKDEKEVKNFLYLPLRSKERLDRISHLRKLGQFENNRQSDPEVILSVRRSFRKDTKLEDVKICPNCKGYYRRLRAHVATCKSEWKKCRTVNILGKKLTQSIHPAASDRLKYIFATLRTDEVTSIVAHDELIIKCSNRWANKYKNVKDENMIRARLRLLGRFLITFNKITSTQHVFKDVFQPQLSNSVTLAINAVAGLCDSTQKYAHPNTAKTLGMLLKKCAAILNYILIENQDNAAKENLKDFCVLLEQNLADSINKTVMENVSEKLRQKNTALPSEDDIKKMKSYLRNRSAVFLDRLKLNKTLANYTNLASFVLVSLIIFNRRRPGETERLLITDYKSSEENIVNLEGKKYIRINLRGKLNRTVKMYIDLFQHECIDILLKYREEVGVSPENAFVFGLPSVGEQNKFMRACPFIRKFSSECEAKNPDLLRATLLRKQVATKAADLKLNDADVGDLADFMGHAEKIHREHYRVSQMQREVKVLNILQPDSQNRVSQDLSEDLDEYSIEEKTCNSDNFPEDKSNDIEMVNSISRKNKHNNSTEDETYICEDSPEDESGDDVEDIPIKRKRFSWSEEEKELLQSTFSQYIQSNGSPGLQDCADFKKKHNISKTVQSIKVYINNLIAKNRRSVFPRLSWSKAEEEEVKKKFHQYLRDGKVPSEYECGQFLKNNKNMKNRSPISVKLWINNFLRKCGNQT